MRTNNKGFTLVELMVVIAILAVLATIGVAVFSTVQRNARDGRSKADINIIARSIETAKSIDANAGTVTYAYSSTSFANDFKTTPTGKYPYCLWSGSSAPATPSATVSLWNGSACPTTPANPVLISGGTQTSGTWVNATYWEVCTLLEAGTVYCAQSISQ